MAADSDVPLQPVASARRRIEFAADRRQYAHTVVTMVDGGRIPDSGEYPSRHSTPIFDIADAFDGDARPRHRNLQDRKGACGSDEGSPATEEPVKTHRYQGPRQEGFRGPVGKFGRGGEVCQRIGPRQAGRQGTGQYAGQYAGQGRPAKKAVPAKATKTSPAAPAKKAAPAKATKADAPAPRGRAKKATAPEPGVVDADVKRPRSTSSKSSPSADLEVDVVDEPISTSRISSSRRSTARRRPHPAAAVATPKPAEDGTAGDDDEIAEPTREGQGLRRLRLGRRGIRGAAAGPQGRRAHRFGGLGARLPQADRQGRAAQRRGGSRAGQAHRGRPLRHPADGRAGGQGREAARRAASRHDCGSAATATAPRTTCSRPTFAWSSRWPSATRAAAWPSST